MPVDLLFTVATRSDAPRLAEMNKRLIEDEGHSNRMSVPELEERMRGWLDMSYTAVIAEEAPGIELGYCLFCEEERHFYLRQLYVEREHRRRGIATALLDRMYADYWVHKPLRLEVLVHNEAAIRFYERYGFAQYALEMRR